MKKFILILIILLASGLRLFKLDQFPKGLNADEAALGYNAFSLMLTGRDEHGHPWPVNLESFGDFKPALYSYLLIPFVKVMGLNEWTVRLPSALIGILGVGLVYLLAKEILSEEVGLISALVLAVSPWHLHFSRGGWETNLATTLLTLAAWAVCKWQKSLNIKWLIITTISLVLSMYAYQSTRVIAPLLGLGILVFNFKKLLSQPKQLLLNTLLLIVLLLPLGISIFKSGAASRFSGVGFLSDEGPLNRAKELRGQHANYTSSLMAKILHNRPVIYTIQFLKNYTDHFNGDFLFVNGDLIERNKVPETGLLYLTDFVFLVIGIYSLIKQSGRNVYLVWWWLLIAPLAAALTFQTPHALRAENMVVPLTILVSIGLIWIWQRWKFIALGALSILYFWQVTRYLHEYYVHYPQAYPAAWEYGFKDLVAYINTVQGKYDKIWITDKYDQPYILFLFYQKYPPVKFQGTHALTFRDKFNFSTVRDYDKYHFESTPWDKVRDVHSTLIVAAPEDIPDVGVNIIKTINFPNGQPAFKIISN